MLRRLTPIALALSLFSVSSLAAADTVTKVQECGNSFLIFLSSGTVLNVWRNDPAMSSWSYDHLYAMSLELLSSGRQIGYHNAVGSPGVTCGVTSQEITVMAATSTP